MFITVCETHTKYRNKRNFCKLVKKIHRCNITPIFIVLRKNAEVK